MSDKGDAGPLFLTELQGTYAKRGIPKEFCQEEAVGVSPLSVVDEE